MIDARYNSYNIGMRGNMPFRVITCVITLMAFFINTFSCDLAWADRTPSEFTNVGSDRAVSPVSPGVLKDLNVNTFALPEYLGHVRDSWGFIGKGNTIIHIQDAHCNYDAQKKIADIIEYINTNYGVSSVNLEGGAKGYDLSIFTSISDKGVREKTSDYFVKEGLVNGAEYFAINNPEKVALWGIEDTALYMDNLNVYRSSLQHKDDVEKSLKSLSYILANLKVKIYSKELLAFDAKYSQYKAGNIDFKDYLNYLLDTAKGKMIDIKGYRNIYLLNQALKEEPSIDFRKANNERDKLIDTLQKKLSRNAMEELVVKTVELKSERISQNKFYTYLLDKAKKARLALSDFPELQKYIVYIAFYDAMDKMKVMDEIDKLEGKIKEPMLGSDSQKRLAQLSKNLAIMKNIFNITMTKDDYRYYKSNEDAFAIRNFTRFIEREAPLVLHSSLRANEVSEAISESGLDRYRDEISKFYEYSFKRDDAFLKNIKIADSVERIANSKDHNLNSNPADSLTANRYPLNANHAAILITGGFHTDNLCEKFRKEGVSYISIMPNFKNPQGYQSPYSGLLSGEPTLAEKAILPYVSMMQVPSYLAPIKDAISKAGLEAFNVDVYIEMMKNEKKKFRITDDKGVSIKGLDFSEGAGETELITVSQLMNLVKIHREGAGVAQLEENVTPAPVAPYDAQSRARADMFSKLELRQSILDALNSLSDSIGKKADDKLVAAACRSLDVMLEMGEGQWADRGYARASDVKWHDYTHAATAAKYILQTMADKYLKDELGISPNDIYIAVIAAMYHDIGYYDGVAAVEVIKADHEERSKDFIRLNSRALGVSKEYVDAVCVIISATQAGVPAASWKENATGIGYAARLLGSMDVYDTREDASMRVDDLRWEFGRDRDELLKLFTLDSERFAQLMGEIKDKSNFKDALIGRLVGSDMTAEQKATLAQELIGLSGIAEGSHAGQIAGSENFYKFYADQRVAEFGVWNDLPAEAKNRFAKTRHTAESFNNIKANNPDLFKELEMKGGALDQAEIDGAVTRVTAMMQISSAVPIAEAEIDAIVNELALSVASLAPDKSTEDDIAHRALVYANMFRVIRDKVLAIDNLKQRTEIIEKLLTFARGISDMEVDKGQNPSTYVALDEFFSWIAGPNSLGANNPDQDANIRESNINDLAKTIARNLESRESMYSWLSRDNTDETFTKMRKNIKEVDAIAAAKVVSSTAPQPVPVSGRKAMKSVPATRDEITVIEGSVYVETTTFDKNGNSVEHKTIVYENQRVVVAGIAGEVSITIEVAPRLDDTYLPGVYTVTVKVPPEGGSVAVSTLNEDGSPADDITRIVSNGDTLTTIGRIGQKIVVDNIAGKEYWKALAARTAVGMEGVVPSEANQARVDATPLYDVAKTIAPKIVAAANRGVGTFFLAPAMEDEINPVTGIDMQVQRVLGKDGYQVRARHYAVGSGDKWFKDTLTPKIKGMVSDFDKAIKGKDGGATRWIIRALSENDKNEILNTIKAELGGINADANDMNHAMDKVKVIIVDVKPKQRLNPVIDLFVDFGLMELDRYGKSDGYEGDATDTFKNDVASLLRQSTINSNDVNGSNINEIMALLFVGSRRLEIKAVDWKSISEWKKMQDSVLASV